MPPVILDLDFCKKENYIDINGNFAEVGRGINGEDIVLDKRDLISGKFLINEKLREQTKEQMILLKNNDKRIYLY
jgi:hypothetical protein